MILDGKAPTGKIQDSWDKHKIDSLKLVNPANKRKYKVLVVGTGLAGASAAASLAEARRKTPSLPAKEAVTMLLGVLGWSAYDGKADVVTPYFGASGTGQINAIFPVTPQDGHAVPKAVASSADGFSTVATRL